VEKYGTATQTTDDNIIPSMRFACWITNATDTHSEYVTLLFLGKYSYTKAPKYNVTHTLPILLRLTLFNMKKIVTF
jgi:hypothetical protein